jgi:hypothetical protein
VTIASKLSIRNLAIVVCVILALTIALASAFYPKSSLSTPKQFDYTLSGYSTNGTTKQGNSLVTSFAIDYVNGTPEQVTLFASGGPNGTTFTFGSQTGTPTKSNPFNFTLTIAVPAQAPSDIYAINITSTASNSRTNSISYALTVLNAEIQVSGRVTANQFDDMWPTKIEFASTANNETYSADVHTTSGSRSSGGLIQTGTYSVSLPNHQSYRVICSWVEFAMFSPPASGGQGSGTFEGANLIINGGVGEASVSANYSD